MVKDGFRWAPKYMIQLNILPWHQSFVIGLGMAMYMQKGSLAQVVGLPTLRMSKGRDLVMDDGKLVIPANTTIWIPLGLPHMSSAIYDHPDRFLPERWLEPDAEYMPTNGAAAIFA